MMGMKKFLVTIIWNPHGFCISDLLPDGAKVNMTYILGNIVGPLQSRIFPARREKQKRKGSLYLDNCSLYRSKEGQEVFERNQIKNVPRL
jgi:hypothetical protein